MRLSYSNIKSVRICYYRDNLVFCDVTLKNSEMRHYCAPRGLSIYYNIPYSVVKFILDDATSEKWYRCKDYPLYDAIAIYKKKEVLDNV